MNNSRRKPGRPRLYATEAEKVHAFHERKIKRGYADVRIMLSKESMALLDRLCAENKMNKAEAISYLLMNYYEEEESSNA